MLRVSTYYYICLQILYAIIPIAIIAEVSAIVIFMSNADLGLNILRWIYVVMSFWLCIVVLFIFYYPYNTKPKISTGGNK